MCWSKPPGTPSRQMTFGPPTSSGCAARLRVEKNKAIVAIARQLLVVIWHVLTERAADHHTDPDMVAFKLMTWSWKLTDEQRGGLTTHQIRALSVAAPRPWTRLDPCHARGGKYLIAPPDEVLKLKPELQSLPENSTRLN